MSRTGGGPGSGGAHPPLAILAGGGAFPLEVAGEARRAGREPFLVGIVGATDSAIEAYPHVWVRMGEVGKLFAALKDRAIAEMVIIGAMTRPELADLRLDWGAVKRAAGLAQLFRRGDNGLLAGLAAIIEREGVRVVGAHEIAPRPPGAARSCWRARPLRRGRDGYRVWRGPPRSAVDLRRGAGRRRRRRPGAGDRGCRRHGRHACPRRGDARQRPAAPFRPRGCAGEGAEARTGSSGSTCRRSGPKTIEAAIKAQLRGVAIAAGRVLVLERALCARKADAAGLFVAGFAYPPTAG